MSAVAVPSPRSYSWGGNGGGGGRAMEASAAKDPRLGDTGASRAGGRPLAAMAASLVFYGGGEGTSLKGDLPATPAMSAATDALEGAVLYTEASPPPIEGVRLPPSLSGLGAREEVPRNTNISPGPRGQTPALSSGSAELP
jgi:hypothetical protein